MLTDMCEYNGSSSLFFVYNVPQKVCASMFFVNAILASTSSSISCHMFAFYFFVHCGLSPFSSSISLTLLRTSTAPSSLYRSSTPALLRSALQWLGFHTSSFFACAFDTPLTLTSVHQIPSLLKRVKSDTCARSQTSSLPTPTTSLRSIQSTRTPKERWVGHSSLGTKTTSMSSTSSGYT